jgi:hypothetical protein
MKPSSDIARCAITSPSGTSSCGQYSRPVTPAHRRREAPDPLPAEATRAGSITFRIVLALPVVVAEVL